ncbi:MAG: diguanylate cyclase [Deltaproteobacteria bacterium]|nr:diguanylate cyclase [Deltaproteobacteria bacterium]
MKTVLHGEAARACAPWVGSLGLVPVEQGAPAGLVLCDVTAEDAGPLLSRRRATSTGQPWVIALLPPSRLDEVGRWLAAGADDCLITPVEPDTLRTRLAVARCHAEARWRVESDLRRLRAERDAYRARARTDALTGLGNRSALEEALAEAASEYARHGVPFALSIVDVDHFKAFNDAHGHLEGDRALVEVARALRDATRRGDGCFRFGGEEFVVLHRHATTADAQQAAERILEHIRGLAVAHPSSPHRVLTVSAGVAVLHATDDGVARWLARADAALYEAKARGRNTLVTAAAPAGLDALTRPEALACA